MKIKLKIKSFKDDREWRINKDTKRLVTTTRRTLAEAAEYLAAIEEEEIKISDEVLWMLHEIAEGLDGTRRDIGLIITDLRKQYFLQQPK